MTYSNLFNDKGDFSEKFLINLVKTINWTKKITEGVNGNSNIDYTHVLRTVNLIYNGRPFYYYGSGFAQTIDIPFDYQAILNEILKLRTDYTLPNCELNQLGRLLQFEIDLTTHDGAPSVESDEFIDESDIPPIDTWVLVTKKYLYCWIPTMFIDKMQAAIDVEIFDSYLWIDTSKIIFNQQVIEKLKSGS